MAEKTEKEYMKEMLPAEKVGHIWHYYKWFLVLGIFAAIVIIFGVRYSMQHPGDYLAEVVMVNADQSEVDNTDFFDDFVSDYGYEDEELDLAFDSSLDIDLEEADSTSSSAYQILAGMFLTAEVDTFISDAPVFDLEIENNAFLDLRDVLDEETLEKYSDRIYYGESPETGEQTPYGIRLDGTSFAEDENIYPAIDPIVGVGSQSENTDIDANVITYLLEHQSSNKN